MWPCNC